mmetsp:Transcript_19935/g.22927  ORF Transcript_19935/g.22927 Transcript_19935/m.22927 type:complete len:95 (-) Transcript_19935:96-380(-)
MVVAGAMEVMEAMEAMEATEATEEKEVKAEKEVRVVKVAKEAKIVVAEELDQDPRIKGEEHQIKKTNAASDLEDSSTKLLPFNYRLAETEELRH